MIMCLFLFGLWLLLNGRITAEICLTGAAVAAGVYAFCVYALGYHPRHEKHLWKRLWLYVVYCFLLIWDILRANFSVMRIILTSCSYHAAIVRLKIPLKKELSRVLLSNSITLTPGTVTVEQSGDDFLVLCLNRPSADAIPRWNLVRILKKLEGEAWN